MKNRIIIATGNEGKLKEIKMMFSDMDLEIISLKETGIDIEIDENGTSFEENAIIKAQAIANVCNEIVLADDSGLVIDALDGEPGIYSARYLGEETSYIIIAGINFFGHSWLRKGNALSYTFCEENCKYF